MHVQCLSKAAKLDRRLARAELRTKQRFWFCEIPDSPDSGEYVPSSNESDEDDFDFGAFIHRATAHANRHNQNCPRPIHQPRRIDVPVQKEKVKAKSPNKRKSPSEDYFRDTLTVRNFHEQSLESSVRPRANKIQNANERHCCALKSKLPSEKRSIKFSNQSLERARF